MREERITFLSYFVYDLLLTIMELKIGVLTLQSSAVPKASKSYLNGLRLALANTSFDVKYVLKEWGLVQK